MKVILFIVSCSIMFSTNVAYSSIDGYIQIPYFLKFGIAYAWFLYFVCKSFFKDHGIITRKRIDEFKIYLVPVLIMSVSFVISLFTNHEMHGAYVSRSLSNIFCYLAIVLCSYVSVNEFGIQSIRYTFYGLILALFYNLSYTIYLYGFFNVAVALVNIFSIVGFKYASGTIMSNIGFSLEVAEITFSLGFFLIYMLIFDKEKMFRKKDLFLCVFGMYVGLKRIQIFAILISVLIYKLYIKKNHSLVNMQRMCFSLVTIASFLFIILIKYYSRIFAFLDVSRVRLYKTLGEMYSVSPLYIGKGYGFVNMWLESVGSKDWLLTVSHSDITRLYIELGFILFIAWIYYYCIALPRYTGKYTGINETKIILCFIVYIFITYFIDNTMTIFAIQFCFIMIPMAVHKGVIKHKTIKITWGN